MRGDRLWVCAVALLCALSAASVVRADIIPQLKGGLPTPAIEGFNWTYSTRVGLEQRADDGDYFTIYDFQGFTGFHNEPAGWTFSTSASGPVPAGTVPLDDPTIPNLTWTWTGASIVGEAPLGDFSAISIYPSIAFDSYAALATRSTGPLIGTDVVNVGFTAVPVPEPTAGALLAGIGLLALRRRK